MHVESTLLLYPLSKPPRYPRPSYTLFPALLPPHAYRCCIFLPFVVIVKQASHHVLASHLPAPARAPSYEK